MHIGLSLDFSRFRITLLRAQRVGQEPARLRLGAAITARECQRLATAALGLPWIVLREPQASALYPQQGIARFDAQCAIESR